MKLWVRSSDKMQLAEINNLSFVELTRGCWNINGNYGTVSLGSYPTRERCLEIIDEIQNILRQSGMILFKDVDITNLSAKDIEPFKAINWCSSPIANEKPEVTVHNAEVVVYEMPSE